MIASFPMSFLLSCGNNTWEYIFHVVSLLVEVDPSHPGEFVDEFGRPINAQEIPVSGTVRYVERGMQS